ncbi:MAG TPA: OmpA family protein [Lentisphaeria bacterium]|nr:OmpA family protein [Lentisphaeria bacterium]
MMKNGLGQILVLALAVSVLAVGCSKKPKLNLEGLQNNPPGSHSGALAGGDSGFAGGGLTPGELDPLFVPGPGATGTVGAAGADNLGGGWAPLGESLGTADSFLKNGSYWNDKVYFDYNRSEVRASERPKLDALASHLRENAGFSVVIEGHCDERGSDEYNRSLSERRSLSVREYLISLGIDGGRMHTISYGEDRPVVVNAVTEADHQKNRRAEFLIGEKK